MSVLFPILVRLNYSDIDAVTEDMRRRHFSEATPSKILLRYACKTKELYEFVTSEYQKQVYELLNGHLQSVEDFLMIVQLFWLMIVYLSLWLFVQ